MTDLLRRLAGVFVEPAPTAPAEPPPAAGAESLIGVVAAPDDLAVAAGAVATAARRAAGARTAVVCRPGRGAAARAATPAASALARRLAGRDLPAVAAGALAHVALPDDPAGAARTLWHVAGAVDVPVVLALPGRLDGFDGVLGQLDRLTLAVTPDADDALISLAVDGLAALGPPAGLVRVPGSPLAARAAALGFAADGAASARAGEAAPLAGSPPDSDPPWMAPEPLDDRGTAGSPA